MPRKLVAILATLFIMNFTSGCKFIDALTQPLGGQPTATAISPTRTATSTSAPSMTPSDTPEPTATAMTETPTATATVTATATITATATVSQTLSADMVLSGGSAHVQDMSWSREHYLRLKKLFGDGTEVTVSRSDPPANGNRHFFCFVLNGQEQCGWCHREGAPAVNVGTTGQLIDGCVIFDDPWQPFCVEPPTGGGNNNPVATATRNVVTATNPPTATQQSTNTPRPSYTPRPSATPIPSDTFEPTEVVPTNQPTNTPRPTYTPRPTSTVIPSDTPAPTDTLVPTATASTTATSTATTTSTSTRTPTSIIINDPASPTPDARTPRSPTATPTDGAYPPPPTASTTPTEEPNRCLLIIIWCTPEPPTTTPVPPTATECPTETPTSTRTPTKTSTPTNTPTPTDTPEPTVEPSPTPDNRCIKDWPITDAQKVQVFGSDPGMWESGTHPGGTQYVHHKEGFRPRNPIRTRNCIFDGYAGDPHQFAGWNFDLQFWPYLLGILNGSSAPTFGMTIHNSSSIEEARELFCIGWNRVKNLPGWVTDALGFPRPTSCSGIIVPLSSGQINRRFVPKGTINRRFVPKATPRQLIVVATAVPPTPEPQYEVVPNGDPVVEAPPPPPAQPTWQDGSFNSDQLVVCKTCKVDEARNGTFDWDAGDRNNPCWLYGYDGHGDHLVITDGEKANYPACPGLN